MKFRRRLKSKNKFCPVCGTKLEAKDTFCTNCGYSFEARHKKSRKGIKWKNLILLLIILAIVYAGFQYFSGKPIIPKFLPDILNITKQ